VGHVNCSGFVGHVNCGGFVGHVSYGSFVGHVNCGGFVGHVSYGGFVGHVSYVGFAGRNYKCKEDRHRNFVEAILYVFLNEARWPYRGLCLMGVRVGV
jgi:hypothetical protein